VVLGAEILVPVRVLFEPFQKRHRRAKVRDDISNSAHLAEVSRQADRLDPNPLAVVYFCRIKEMF